MNLPRYFFPFALLSFMMAGCINDDSDFEDLMGMAKEEPIEITFHTSPLDEDDDEVPSPSDTDYNDYIESFTPSTVVSIVYTEERAEVSNPSTGIAIVQNGAHVEANIHSKAVRFILTGKSQNGSLKVIGENRFAISLDNLSLTNPSGAVINNQCSKTLYIDSEPGTLNTLTSGEIEASASEAKGCLFSEGQIAFSGRGRLDVVTSFRNAIASDDYIFTRSGCHLNITARSGNGIKANDGIRINGGTIDILVEHNGSKGLNSESSVIFNGGRTTIINTATTRIEMVEVSDQYPDGIDTVNSAGIKSDGDCIVNGGMLLIKCTGDNSKGINSNRNYAQKGGDVYIVTTGRKELASPKCLKTDNSIDITGGYLYAYSLFSEPIDSDSGEIGLYNILRQTAYLLEIGQCLYPLAVRQIKNPSTSTS